MLQVRPDRASRGGADEVYRDAVETARKRCAHLPNVAFRVADAYSLENLCGAFNAAFAHWWWSHIPKSRIREFISTLHARLQPCAFVLFADQLLYEWPDRRLDSESNVLETRSLPDGRKFEIVKNFPSARELTEILGSSADELRYVERPDEGNWELTYFLRGA